VNKFLPFFVFLNRFLKLAAQRPLQEMATPEELAALDQTIRESDSSLVGASFFGPQVLFGPEYYCPFFLFLQTDEQVRIRTREMIVKKKHEIHKKNEEEIRKRWHFEEAVCFFSISFFVSAL